MMSRSKIISNAAYNEVVDPNMLMKFSEKIE